MRPSIGLLPAQHRNRRFAQRAVRAAWLCTMVALPLQASSAQTAPTAALPFDTHFEGIIEPLAPDLGTIDPVAPPSSVDLSSFDPPVEQREAARPLGAGIASYYGRRFHGRPTASGERFDMTALTAAHRTLPFGSLVRVTNPRNGRSVTVRINDRGPFTGGRLIDLSRAAAEQIGIVAAGHGQVELELLGP
ncbi:septal ring lytic transglycosylase RlpA family protein [Qipengyuania sp. ASV99]|uniref:septal ring lytic transglycosylase RlpA family protein n=1 Tax=Qipengyuania sp. ASV99 TaxID=3399681 RepID=UPI003A4C821F